MNSLGLDEITKRHSSLGRTLRRHAARLGIAVVALTTVILTTQLVAGANSSAAGCNDPTPYKWHPVGPAAVSNRSAAQPKLAGVADPSLQAELARAEAVGADPAIKQQQLDAALKRSTADAASPTMDQACSSVGARRGSLLELFQKSLGTNAHAAGTISYGNGYAWLDNLNQQGQTKSYYCGPAAVSELSTSMVAPAVSQATAAPYMHTDQYGQTYASDETNGANQYVGRPVFGANFYLWVSLPDPPSTTQKNDFWNRVVSDVRWASAGVIGDAYEVANYDHLPGHPNLTIRHYIQIGGYNYQQGPKEIYYSDSATTMKNWDSRWGTVPPFSWIGSDRLAIILGGLGYIW